MRTFIAIFICLLLLISGMMAQERKPEAWDVKAEKKYISRQEEVKGEVWSIKQAGFRNRTVPAEYAKESAVVLARHVELITPQKNVKLHRTERNLVAINDKAALEQYSEFEFKQYLNSDYYYPLEPFDKLTKITYIGVRIYKKDGSMREIYGNEAVVTDLVRKEHKTRKLAIPDLQVGDLVDYFIREEEFMKSSNAFSKELFVLGEEVPVLEYSIHIAAWNEVFALEYRSMNGAPNFKERFDTHMIHLDMLVRNIPPVPRNLWMNPFRQLPMVRAHLRPGARNEKAGRRKEGMIYSNPNAVRVRDEAISSGGYFPEYGMPSADAAKSFIAKFKKNHPDASKQELAEYIYYIHRFVLLYRVWPGDPIVVDRRRNYSDPGRYAFLLSVMSELKKNDIPADIVLLTSRFGPSDTDVFTERDYEMMVKTRGDKPLYMSAVGMFPVTSYIPDDFEGQKAPLIHDGEITGYWDIPFSKAEQNKQLNRLRISLKADNIQQLEINRETIITGHFKQRTQQQLFLFEDYYDEEREYLGIETSFLDEFAAAKASRALVQEYNNAFSKARRDQKELFQQEVAEQFEKTPQSLDSFKLVEMGLRNNKPDVVYKTRFTMDGFVKKAGPNYILDAGKLIGGQISIKPSQRTRSVDVQMPFARTIEYEMEMEIPEGFVAEGVEKLARNVDNECGSFIVKPGLDANKLRLHITKTYKQAVTPAAKWPLLLEMLDAAEAFREQKVLIKKVG